jgi:hydrogenase maturation factor
MSNEQQIPIESPKKETLNSPLEVADNSSCERDAEGHCITCSDEALPASVICVNQHTGIACVRINDAMEEVDITLMDNVVPGDVLLVHGGVAIGYTDDCSSRDTHEVTS